LELIYRDAYGNQLNDRYLGKVNSYKDLAKWASVMLLQTGVGVVADPIAVASSPEVDIVTGAQPASPYFVQIAWLNAGGEEGMAGPVHSVNAPDQHSLQVKAIGPPANAAAWNVFVGTSIDVICLQNSQPVAVDQIWSMPSSGLVSGRVPGVGQEPQYFTQLPRFLQRG
jgi:hypothetical protein